MYIFVSDGVQDLEKLLSSSTCDKTKSGFVSLKQLTWALNETCQLNIEETELMDICMGMTFNKQAQLDYKEFLSLVSLSQRNRYPNG